MAAVRIMKEKLADHLVNGIHYERLDEWYEMTQWEPEIPSWEEYLMPAKRSVYDHVIFQSNKEKEFAEALDKRGDVKLYVKLPAWFVVDTPVGPYNPDWAIVMEDRDEHGEPAGKPLLYLVRETKGVSAIAKLRPSEARKTVCGEKHFEEALDIDYKVVTSINEIR
jgi:type III restriction enzyme